MKRLYFLIPDTTIAKSIVDDLLLADVEEKHIHVIAKEGTPLDELPEASLLQKSDLIPALEKGAALGGVTGILTGVLAVTFPPAGIILGGGGLLGITLASAGIGAWLSSMIGVDVENSQLKAFEAAIHEGQILMLIDIPKERVSYFTERVQTIYPEVFIEGTEDYSSNVL